MMKVERSEDGALGETLKDYESYKWLHWIQVTGWSGVVPDMKLTDEHADVLF